uniref:beta strand repeat-containing protein n=1 Tax=Flavobacterium sp. TaxID=239 RepID=UPI004047AA0E
MYPVIDLTVYEAALVAPMDPTGLVFVYSDENSNVIADPTTFSPTATTIVSVEIFNGPCSNFDIVDVIVDCVPASCQLDLTSAATTTNQTICIGESVTDITYTFSGDATNASVIDLPTGVSATVSSGVVTISGTPTTTGSFTYTVTTTGCTPELSLQGTITIATAPVFTSLLSNTPICSGEDAIFTLQGSAGATVEYTIDGGAIQTETLDASGEVIITIPSVTANTTIQLAEISIGSCTVTLTDNTTVVVNPIPDVPTIDVTAPTCALAGFATITNYDITFTYTFTPAGPTISATGLVENILYGTSYVVNVNNGNCTSADSTPFTVQDILAVPDVPTLSITAPTCTASGFATITNYDGTLTYDFTPAGPTVDATGLISGMTFGTSYEVAANNGSCSSVNSAAFTIQDILVTPAVPTIAETAPTCLADGFSTITNYDGTLTYTFNPTGPSVDAAGLISGMMLNTMYEVTASNATCTSAASAQFSNLPILVTPVAPVVSETVPTCLAAGFANITNYDAALTYVFTPAGPTVGAGGLISGMAFATSYEVSASNGSCSSVNSTAFTIQDILVTPVVPTIATTAPTCLADGFSEISNYDGALTYVFTPAGPSVDAAGLISGMMLNTMYEVTASNATCTSAASAQFSNLPMLVTPVVPVVSETAPTCLVAGFANITNYDTALTYVFTPVGPTVDGTGLISGMTFGTSYEVAANNGSCSSVNSAAFTISPILPQPTIVSITNNGPICLGGTAIFTINATPNTQVTYSVNGNPTQTVAINASGVGVVNVAGATGTTTINTVSVFDGICSSNLVLSSVVNLFANTTISLISTSGTDSQSRCAGVTIDPIQYQVTGTATGVVVTGLPAGVTYDYNVATGLVTISGAANVGGVYNYSITTSGGCNPQASASGSITITGLPVLSYSVTNTICDGSTLDFVLNSSLPNTTYSWSATVSNITGSYSTTTNGDETNINQIATLTNAENIGTITMIIVPMANGCYGAASSPIIITVNPIPVVESVSVADSSVCSATNATN